MILAFSRIIFESFVLVYFIVINTMYTIVFLISFIEVRKQKKRSFIDDYDYFYRSKLAPGVSLIVTAYNESLNIRDSINSYLKLQYPKFEIIVSNDGSTDDTLKILIDEFKLKKVYHVLQDQARSKPVTSYYVSEKYPNLIVVNKENGGKADALNAGLNAAHYPYFASLDGDAILQPDALLRIMKPIFENPRRIIGAGGIIRVINDCIVEEGEIKEVELSKNPLVIFQTIEYIRAFTASRAGFSLLKSLPIVSGAFSLYNTSIAREIGGYDPDAIGEDFEFLTRIHRTMKDKKRDYEVKFLAYPICWTEVPQTFKALGMQRNRWHRGLISVLHKHERMIFNPRYGRIGFFSLPFFFFFEFVGPIIETLGYFYIILALLTFSLKPTFFFSFLLLAILWGTLLSMLAVLYEDLNFRWYKKWYQVLFLIFFAIIENVSYRQITVFWRIQGLIAYLRGEKSWGSLQRKGFRHHHV
ncbi:MAG: glycosyltransferase [Candidatus Margulisiibacteriota bacterium]